METRVHSGFHVAHQNDDDVCIEHYEDVEPILRYAARMRGTTQRRTPSGMRKIATIPNVIYYDWLRKGIVQDDRKFRQAIEAYKKLKCVEDRLWIPTRVQKQIHQETGIVK